MAMKLYLGEEIFRKEAFFADNRKSDLVLANDDLTIDVRRFVRYLPVAPDNNARLERVYAAVRAVLEQYRDYAPEDFCDFDEEEYWLVCEQEGDILDCDDFAERNPQVVDDLEQWAEELMEDIGYLPTDLPWLVRNHIDFDGIAEELLNSDYSSIEKEDGSFIIYRNV